MITAEVALYPTKTNNATQVINNSIDVLKGTNAEFTVNSMNTRIKGTKDEIFNSLEAMFTQAENSGSEIDMVVTLSNHASS